MSKKVDVLVIGGGPAGTISAVTTKKYYPDKKITLIKDVENGCIPCGIPYMFSSLKNPDENKLGNAALEKNKIDLEIDEAISINRGKKEVTTKTGNTYTYGKLILAIGSTPITPPIPGIDKEGVYAIYKDMDYLKEKINEIKNSRHVMILGGGFIGVEFADEIAKISGVKVTIVEMLPSLLSHSFDPEFSEIVEQKLTSQGIDVLTGIRVEEIRGNKKVEKVILSGGKELEVDSIVLGVGSTPNTKLAFDAGLDRGKGKGIWVDEYMRTSDPDIFAVGDCAGKRDFYTRKDTAIMLASTATAEARIAGANLFKLKVVRENKGTISTIVTFTPLIFAISSANSTPISGGISAGEVINIIGLAIQQRVSATELETLQIATHPYLTSAPTMYPIIAAAQSAPGI
ncbi:MAG: NAD(P)/FAD-dependent oxidoreductase [candidate division WOR-3 bacterium]